MRGGGAYPCPDFLAPFFYQVIVLKISFFYSNFNTGLFGESQDCPPQDWPHGGQSWGGQSWALSVIRIAHLNYNTIFSLPAWFRVVTIDSGCFDMISTYLIQSASMFNWFIIRFIMDTQIHKKVQLNIFTHWVICVSTIQPWKGKWAGRGLLYKYISVHPA